jgi:hypothetical protein
MHSILYRKMDKDSTIVESSKATGKEIMAQPENVSLANLTACDVDKTFYVKAYRKWTVTNKHGRPVMFCCMLLDKQVQSSILSEIFQLRQLLNTYFNCREKQ